MNTQIPTAALLMLEQPDSLLPPRVVAPAYKSGVFGEWELVAKPVTLIRGYFRGMQQCQESNYVLRNNATKVVWMSLTPLELESHAFHIELARGHVVVGGLGMGMYLHNICRKPEVTKVTVIEKNEAVIDAFAQFSGHEDWEGAEKVTIVQDDLLDLSPDTIARCKNCHYLYVDIWPTIGASEALGDMPNVCKVLTPKEASWWCQEMDYVDAEMTLRNRNPKALSKHFADKYGIPANGHKIPSYMELSRRAALNVMLA